MVEAAVPDEVHYAFGKKAPDIPVTGFYEYDHEIEAAPEGVNHKQVTQILPKRLLSLPELLEIKISGYDEEKRHPDSGDGVAGYETQLRIYLLQRVGVDRNDQHCAYVSEQVY